MLNLWHSFQGWYEEYNRNWTGNPPGSLIPWKRNLTAQYNTVGSRIFQSTCT